MNFAFSNPFRSAQSVRPLPAHDAVRMHAEGAIQLIDVRGHDEVAQTGKAKGAIHIPLFQLAQQADPRHPEFHPELKADLPVAVYCASGGRSQMAGQTLSQFGFAEVYNIGGLFHWQSAGGACER